MRLLAWAGAVAAMFVASGSGTTLLAASSAATDDRTTAGQLRAFERPARPSDSLPRAISRIFTSRHGGIVASRRVATATGPHSHAALYLVLFKRSYLCMIQVLGDGSAGAGCDPSGEFLSAKHPLNVGTGNRFLQGVVANTIARVAFVDSRGRSHPLSLTRDGGFLYACRHRNGCVDVVKAVNGYDHGGRLISHERIY